MATLIAAGVLRPVWSSAYVAARLADGIAAAGLDELPLVEGAHESSLWVVKA